MLRFQPSIDDGGSECCLLGVEEDGSCPRVCDNASHHFCKPDYFFGGYFADAHFSPGICDVHVKYLLKKLALEIGTTTEHT